MSGTSVDGIDAVVVDFGTTPPSLVASHSHTFSDELTGLIHKLINNPVAHLHAMGNLDTWLGQVFADATLEAIKFAGLKPEEITAVGSHGQTIWHQPERDYPFSWQLGNPSVIAKRTGIPVVADFRQADIALGGQGAPLVPAFHRALFSGTDRVIANIGGIANITVLSGDETMGFDTGPGNTLMDAWIQVHQDARYDQDGTWAAQGKVDQELLRKLLATPYFAQAAPKSTGRELFHLAWLREHVGEQSAVDVQATLLELTAISLSDACNEYSAEEVLVCGGGAHNTQLMQRLSQLCATTVNSTATQGVDPDWIEGMAFAWLAKAFMERTPGNVPSVTGASAATILGGLFLP